MKLLLALSLCIVPVCLAQRGGPPPPPKVFLWPDGAPGALGSEDSDKPNITVFLPRGDHRTRTGVIICPGGSYRALSMEKEGSQVAQWFNSMGIAGFVLQYRLGPKYHHPIELGDVQRAIRLVRSRAAEYGLSVNKIGVMGFSAGGHLASTAETMFDKGNPSASDPIDRVSSRPDFAVLAYPVISMSSEFTHQGSKNNLLGENADPALAKQMSTELQVKPDTPPTFLFQTTADTTVPAENATMFYLALRKQHIPAEIHIYERGPHGVGLGGTDATLITWPERLADWMREHALLDSAE